MNSKSYLLACSNYYPHSFGGTEVYVENYAQFIKQKGDIVYIITATPKDYFNKENLIYADNVLKVCKYNHNNITVFGVHYQNTISTEFIYSKYDPSYTDNWKRFIQKQPELSNLNILHIHSFTAIIGVNLFKAIINHNAAINVITSYHTPISCPKGTLMFQNLLEECKIAPSVKTCCNCMLATQQKFPLTLAKFINQLQLKHYRLPSVLRQKYLTELEIQSFQRLKNITQEWWCYSEGVLKNLLLNNVDKSKIKMVRHGVNECFLNVVPEKNPNKVIFLFSGRMVKIKGISTLLKSWLMLNESSERELWITSDGNCEEAEIRQLIFKAKQRTDIQFIGTQSPQELANIYQKVQVVIIPSEWFEIGPLVFHEAIASGCDVIASNIGGCKELANYYNQKTFEAGNYIQLNEIILSTSYITIKKKQTETFVAHFKNLSSEHSPRTS